MTYEGYKPIVNNQESPRDDSSIYNASLAKLEGSELPLSQYICAMDDEEVAQIDNEILNPEGLHFNHLDDDELPQEVLINLFTQFLETTNDSQERLRLKSEIISLIE